MTNAVIGVAVIADLRPQGVLAIFGGLPAPSPKPLQTDDIIRLLDLKAASPKCGTSRAALLPG